MPPPSLVNLPLQSYIHRLNKVYKNDLNTLIIQYLISHGCVNKCSFCRRVDPFGFQAKPPEKVVREIKELCSRYNTNYVKLETNEVNPTEDYILKLCDEIERQELKCLWHTYARLNHLKKSTLARMYDCGCILLRFGVESGSQRLLDKMNKKYHVFEMEQILRDSSEAGIWNAIYLMCGLPGETENDIADTVSFINRNKNYIHGAAINVFFLLNGTDIYLHPENYNIRLRMNNEHELSFDEIDGLPWEQKKTVAVNAVNQIQNVLIAHNIGLSAVCTDLMFSSLLKFRDIKKTQKWLKEHHPYLFEVLPPNIVRWRIYHQGEAPPPNLAHWYYYKKAVGTIINIKQ